MMAVTTLFTVMAATIMMASSASLTTHSTTTEVSTTMEVSQMESKVKAEMNQCIDKLGLDEMYVIDIIFILKKASRQRLDIRYVIIITY